MSSEGTGDATAVTVKSYAFGFLPTGSLTGESVERYIVKASCYQDVLVGGAGNDFLDGRGGLDIFKGSAGDDSYVFDTVGEKVTAKRRTAATTRSSPPSRSSSAMPAPTTPTSRTCASSARPRSTARATA